MGNLKTVLAAMETLEKSGTVFSIEGEGRLGISPHPPIDSPILKFAARYKGNILHELAKRLDNANLEDKATSTFGAPKSVVRVSIKEMTAQCDALFKEEFREEDSLEKRLAILVQVVAIFDRQGLQVQRDWVTGYIDDLIGAK